MSILPTQANGSKPSSSPTLSQNPNFNHGLSPPPPQQLLDFPLSDPAITDTLTPPSLHISAGSPISLSYGHSSGPNSSEPAGSIGSSKKVSEVRTPNGRKNWQHQHHGSSSHAGRGGLSSQFRSGKIGPNRQTTEPIGFHGSSAHSAGRRNQTTNGNHLLNFQYDRISRPQPRFPPPPRKQQKIKPYNRDLFIQANYKFVMLNPRNDELESMDPDKMLEWDNVVCVKYSTPQLVQCPICLESPLCPQITTCGHIFCFPCILRYLLMGAEDHKGDCWKRCPLCFMMVSSKDLYTINIETVKQYNVDNNIQFTLLTRAKDSLIPSQRNQQGADDDVICVNDNICDSFSRFTIASEVELSVREAISDLNGWLAKAESGLVDDLEQLPYVCAAMEQLEQRKKNWAELRSLSCRSPLKDPATPCSDTKACKYTSKIDNHVVAPNANVDVVNSELSGSASSSPPTVHKYETRWAEKTNSDNSNGEEYVVQNAVSIETFEGGEIMEPSSFNENKGLQKGSDHVKEKESYTFYQAVDGQHLILHPLNMKCLLNYYGSYDTLPPRISGKILQMETVTQSEAMRRRYRYLSHFSLTTTFQLCEIDLSELLPCDALSPFIDEIKKRENQRKRLAEKEHKEKIKAEAEPMPIPSNFSHSSRVGTTFSMEDFEALGSSSVSSTSPPIVGERKRFSEVTRLGFAAGIDSTSFTSGGSAETPHNTEARTEVAGVTGSRGDVTLSFANIISTAKSDTGNGEVPKANGLGKKGKKPSRVLLSTAGGRRY